MSINNPISISAGAKTIVTTTAATSPYIFDVPPGAITDSIKIDGKDADLVINGKSFNETMAKIEDRLGILVPNPELEKEFDELRQAAEHYKKLEKKFLEQKKIFDILKTTDL
jgi:hypothetical protein